MNFISKNWKGLLLCLALAVPASLLGKQFPIIGGPVFAILGGMIFAPLVKNPLHQELSIHRKRFYNMQLCY